MTPTPAGLALIQRWESCRLEAYQDSGGLWTIGWGTTKYPDGRRVAAGDRCTQAEADAWFRRDVERVARTVDALTVDTLRPAQFDALVSFTYNVGEGAFRRSTLRDKVNADPNDPAILGQFLRWIYDGGVLVPGLRNRRRAEAAHYFTSDTLPEAA